jgi:site-specific recombinase XerD
MIYRNEFLCHLKECFSSESTIQRYSVLLKKFGCYLKERGIDDASAVTPKDVQGFIGNSEKGHNDSYVWFRLISLRRYFSFLEERGLIFISPFLSIKLPKKPIHHYPTLKQNQIEAILDAIPDDSSFLIRGKAILETAYSSALRPGEIIRLKISEIDFKNRTLFIRQSKNRKDRVVPIGKTALEWIGKYISEVRPRHAKQHYEVFISHKTGSPLTLSGLNRAINDTLRKSNLPVITPYSIRSTSATALLENGMGLSFISALLGHAKLTTTQIYLQTDLTSLTKKLDSLHPRNSFQKEETQYGFSEVS